MVVDMSGNRLYTPFFFLFDAAGTDWGVAGAEAFEDTDGRLFLPARVLSRVVRWLRPKDLIIEETG